ncbi:MAG TPA: class I SAM-dependent methyltransferase [Stellaceae bacterium]|jgi:cephalosporin hydroxylase|nr:class I SAM-dependent methyltransferase [Stellaceae bacterium]
MIRGTDVVPVRHLNTFLTLAETAVDRRFECPYIKTYEFDGDFIDDVHRSVVSGIDANGMIDFGIEGWLLPADALKLYELVHFCRGDVLELGTYRGLSAAVAALSSTEAGIENVVISFDMSPTETETARQNLRDRPGHERVHLFSVEAGQGVRDLARAKRMFNFAFVDHSHQYEYVFDVCQSLHRVMYVGAFALFHDFNDPRNAAQDAPDYGVYQGVLDGLDPRRFEFWGIYGCSGLFRRIGPV